MNWYIPAAAFLAGIAVVVGARALRDKLNERAWARGLDAWIGSEDFWAWAAERSDEETWP